MKQEFLSYFGLLNQNIYTSDILTEAKYALKYKYGIDIENFIFEGDKKFGIKDSEDFAIQNDTVKTLVLINQAIKLCNENIIDDVKYFDKADKKAEELYSAKFLFLIVKTFIQKESIELIENSKKDKGQISLFKTKSKNSVEWRDTSKSSSQFSKYYDNCNSSYFSYFFGKTNNKRYTYNVVPFLVKYQRATFFLPIMAFPACRNIKESIDSKYNSLKSKMGSMDKDERKEAEQVIKFHENENEHSSFQGYLSYLITKTEPEKDYIMTTSFYNKTFRCIHNIILEKSLNQYIKYFKRFLKKYKEKLELDDYIEMNKVKHYNYINDYVAERFNHFSFIQNLACHFDCIYDLKKSELFIPLALSENIYSANLYIQFFSDTILSENLIQFDTSAKSRDSFTYDHSIDRKVQELSKLTQFMNLVYYPALYYTFLLLIIKYKVDLEGIGNLAKILNAENSNKINIRNNTWMSSKEDKQNTIVSLLNLLFKIKAKSDYNKLVEDITYIKKTPNVSYEISRIIYMLQRMYSYPKTLKSNCYCEEFLKVIKNPNLIVDFCSMHNNNTVFPNIVEAWLNQECNESALEQEMHSLSELNNYYGEL